MKKAPAQLPIWSVSEAPQFKIKFGEQSVDGEQGPKNALDNLLDQIDKEGSDIRDETWFFFGPTPPTEPDASETLRQIMAPLTPSMDSATHPLELFVSWVCRNVREFSDPKGQLCMSRLEQLIRILCCTLIPVWLSPLVRRHILERLASSFEGLFGSEGSRRFIQSYPLPKPEKAADWRISELVKKYKAAAEWGPKQEQNAGAARK